MTPQKYRPSTDINNEISKQPQTVTHYCLKNYLKFQRPFNLKAHTILVASSDYKSP